MGENRTRAVAIDPGRLAEARRTLVRAAEALDRRGLGRPDGDLGAAAVLVAGGLVASADAVASLVTESSALVAAVDLATSDLADTDVREALELYRLGECA